MKRITLIRHGATEANTQKFYAGSTDLPLTTEGERQAEALTERVKAMRPDKILSSPLRRAQDTAKIATSGINVEIEIDDNLREVDFGKWERKSYTQLARDHKDELDRWFSWDPDFGFPEGESFKQFSERVKDVMKMIIDESAGSLIVFTHGGVISHLMCLILNLPFQNQFSLVLPTASFVMIEQNNGALLLKESSVVTRSRRG
jgi:alpha-ribazole phosphatase